VKIQLQWVVTPGKQTNKHSALVNFMQVFDDRFQAESGGNWFCYGGYALLHTTEYKKETGYPSILHIFSWHGVN